MGFKSSHFLFVKGGMGGLSIFHFLQKNRESEPLWHSPFLNY